MQVLGDTLVLFCLFACFLWNDKWTQSRDPNIAKKSMLQGPRALGCHCWHWTSEVHLSEAPSFSTVTCVTLHTNGVYL